MVLTRLQPPVDFSGHLPDEAKLLASPDDLASLIVATTQALAAPRSPDLRSAEVLLTPWAARLMGRVTFQIAPGTIDLVVREFLNDLAHSQYFEVSAGLWLLSDLSAEQVKDALFAVWTHPEVAHPLALIIRHDNAEFSFTLGHWISAGAVINEFLTIDPHLEVVGPGVTSYHQRQVDGEPVVLHRVVSELHAVLDRLTR